MEVRYRPLQENAEGEMQDIPQAVCTAVDELAVGGLRGDILVFLPGEREIRDTAEALRKHHPVGVEILPSTQLRAVSASCSYVFIIFLGCTVST